MELDAATVERLYAGALAEEPWRDTVEMLCSRLDAIICALAFRTVRTDMPSVGVHAFRQNGRAVWNAFFEGYRDVVTFPYDRMEPGVVHALSDVIDDATPGIARMHAEMHVPMGVGETYAMALWDRGMPVAYLIWVKAAGHPIRTEEQGWAALTACPLGSAIGGYHRMRVAELSGRLAADALGRLDVGVVAIDEQGLILFSNDVAQRLVAQCADIGMHGGHLVMARADLAARLEASRKGPQAAQVRGAQDSAIGLMMVPVDRGRDELGPESRPERALYLHEVARSAPIPEQLIAELFGLSLAEARLTALLCVGLTLREAATRIDITENSARTYSKLVFSKLGVSRQAELVRRILTSVAMFGNIRRT